MRVWNSTGSVAWMYVPYLNHPPPHTHTRTSPHPTPPPPHPPTHTHTHTYTYNNSDSSSSKTTQSNKLMKKQISYLYSFGTDNHNYCNVKKINHKHRRAAKFLVSGNLKLYESEKKPKQLQRNKTAMQTLWFKRRPLHPNQGGCEECHLRPPSQTRNPSIGTGSIQVTIFTFISVLWYTAIEHLT